MSYERSWLRYDAIAGITLAAYAIPVSLAYASLAGVPPQMGLYCYLAGGLAYAVFGSSRHLAIGPTSAISLLLGMSLLEMSQGDTLRQAGLASLTALAMAGVLFLAWLLRLSVLVSFISESILTGFKAGAALVIAATQLPKLLGVAGGGDDFFERLWRLAQQVGSTHSITFVLGLVGVVLLVVSERRFPGKPTALAVVFVAILVVMLGHFDRRGVHIVGEIPAGLPRFSANLQDVGTISLADGRQIVRLACACFLLSYIESISAARAFALKHRYDIDSRQELLAIGAATAFAGLWQGYPLAGGLSQTAVNERGGARTPLSLVIASGAICCVLMFLTGLFRMMPDAILAAVVLVAVKGLIDVRELQHLWKVSRLDFAAAAVALAGVLLMGVLDGVLIAVLASVVMLLWRSARPHVAFLGRIPGTDRFSDVARHPENELIPGVIAFRVQASVLYFNSEHILDMVLHRTRSVSGVRRVICDLSNTPYVDVSGGRMFRRLHEELSALGIDFKIVDAHGPVRDLLRGEGLEQFVGSITRRNSLADLISSN